MSSCLWGRVDDATWVCVHSGLHDDIVSGLQWLVAVAVAGGSGSGCGLSLESDLHMSKQYFAQCLALQRMHRLCLSIVTSQTETLLLLSLWCLLLVPHVMC